MKNISSRKYSVLFLCFLCLNLLLCGCGKKERKFYSVRDMLEGSLIDDEIVVTFKKNNIVFHFSILRKLTRERYLGIGFAEMNPSEQAGIFKQLEIVIFTDEIKNILRIYEHKYGIHVLATTTKAAIEEDKLWIERVVSLRKNILKQYKDVYETMRQRKPFLIQYSSGTEFYGVPSSVSSRLIENILALEKNDAFLIQEPYTEYSVNQLSVPIVTSYDEKREPSPSTYMRLRNSVVKLKSDPGLITNRFLWAANNGNFYDYEFNLNLDSEHDLSVLRLSNHTGENHTLQLIDIPLITACHPQTDRFTIKAESSYLKKLKHIRKILDTAWEERSIDKVFVRFKNRAPFIGKLVEYIPSYHYDRIVHAVLENDDGNYIILHDPDDIKTIASITTVDVRKWNAYVTEVQKMAPVRFVEKPVMSLSQTEPIVFRCVTKWTRDYSVTINSLAMRSSIHLPDFRNPSLFIEPPEIGYTFMIIEGKISCSQQPDKERQLYHDEFKIYDQTGHFYSIKAFVALEGISHKCCVDRLSPSFKLLVMVPQDKVTFFFQFRDSNPVMLSLRNSAPLETSE